MLSPTFQYIFGFLFFYFLCILISNKMHHTIFWKSTSEKKLEKLHKCYQITQTHTYTTYINRKIRNTIFNIVQPITVNYGVHQLLFINQNEMNVKEDSNDDARCILQKNAGMLLSQILNPLNISYDFFSLI